MEERRVTFTSGRLQLEGVLAIPEGAGPFPAVVVCHPHSLYGGSMDNNVVCALTETLALASLVAFRFNFRGVGGSQGQFGQGRGEREDVASAISFLATVSEADPSIIGLTGYSASAAFALPVGCDDGRVRALAAVSPPFSMSDFAFLRGCLKPKLLVSGSRDALVQPDRFLAFCRDLPEPKEYELIRGADHFWLQRESRLAATVTAFFAGVLKSRPF